jgi:hypothetical protein
VIIGVVSPGAMGSAVGAALVRGGARVVATVEARSDRTRRLADLRHGQRERRGSTSRHKGSTAILVQALLPARRNGVLEHVLEDLRLGAPELVARVERRLASSATKAHR